MHTVRFAAFSNVSKRLMAKATNPLIKQACIRLHLEGQLTREEIADHFEVRRKTVNEWIRIHLSSLQASTPTCDKVIAINYNLDRLAALYPHCKDQKGTILTLRRLIIGS